MVEEARLHPLLTALLRGEGWEGLTAIQSHALDPLLLGRHALVVAPTGHGKTEAALLPVLSRMLAERDRLAAAGKPWPPGFKALYVTPLRALNRDLLRRLSGWGKALGFAIGVRHGDTTPAERSRQARDPPDLLITTPETLQLLLYGDTLRRHLATVRFVVLDEVHDLAASERGAQLLVALERLEEVVGQPEALRSAPAAQREGPTKSTARAGGGFQRIGLSATVADPEAVARRIAGADTDGTPRPVQVLQVEGRKEIRLQVIHPVPDETDQELSERLSLPPAAVAQLRAVRRVCEAHRRVIVFHNTRDGAELLASRSALLDGEAGRPPLLGLHHGSLSAEHRTDVEESFKRGDLRALVATSSLELGIDVGALDHVVQVQSPRSVARLVQRLGRSGHTVAGVAEGTLLASGSEDALECLAVARRAREGRLEPLRMRDSPLVVLANQLVALTNEYKGLDRDWTWRLVRRSGPFADLDEGLFDEAWKALLRFRTLFADSERPRCLGRGGRARRHFLEHISLIPDEKAYRIVDESTKRGVGTVDDAYVAAALPPGALFVMAGRSWQVLEVQAEERRVRVAPAKDLGAVPQWFGSQLPVSFEVAQEVAALRRAIAEDDRAALALYPGAEAVLEHAAAPVRAHMDQGLVVPTDRRVTIEVGRRTAIVNVALGTRGNEALARITQALLSQRLGSPVGVESDAYRIHLTFPGPPRAAEILEAWRGIEPPAVDLLLSIALRDSPLLRHHLVHVAKHFGALPAELDPNRFTRAKLDELMADTALAEESTSRLLWDRMDVEAVQAFLSGLASGAVEATVQAIGPLSLLGVEETRRLMAPPKTSAALVAAVRARIEASDVLMACCHCGHAWPSRVADLPRRIQCRRCQSIQVACLRPWNEDKVPFLRRDTRSLTAEERAERERMVRNGALVAAFGPVAAACLVGRGVGPDTAARILQKTTDPEDPNLWREILLAELNFARTNAYWR